MTEYLQINLHCSKAAQDLLHQTAAECSIDFVSAAEYNKLGGANWFVDTSNKTAIINVTNNQLDDTGTSEAGFRWIESGGERLYSCYWSPISTYAEYIDFTERLERSIKGSTKRVFVAGDFSVWHLSWGSRKNNRRGKTLYDMIVGLNLVICNLDGSPTFEFRGRQSIVDKGTSIKK